MQFLYSPRERGIFSLDLHAKDAIPDDVVEITPEQYRQIVDGVAAGGAVEMADTGHLQVVLPKPVVINEETLRIQQERAWRNAEIERVKWLRERHRDELDQQLATSLDGDQFGQLLVYVQQLRDWPQSQVFPDPEHRPLVPDWISLQTQ